MSRHSLGFVARSRELRVEYNILRFFLFASVADLRGSAWISADLCGSLRTCGSLSLSFVILRIGGNDWENENETVHATISTTIEE